MRLNYTKEDLVNKTTEELWGLWHRRIRALKKLMEWGHVKASQRRFYLLTDSIESIGDELDLRHEPVYNYFPEIEETLLNVLLKRQAERLKEIHPSMERVQANKKIANWIGRINSK